MTTTLHSNEGIPKHLLWIIIIMAALTVANLHYNVPQLEVIRQSLGCSQVDANLITVFTQAGYAIGIIFIVALGDLYDARRIITINFTFLIASLLVFAWGQHIEILWAASLITGISSVAVQMYIPMVARYSKASEKSRNVGLVVSGLLMGVLLARSAGGILGAWIGWRMLYVLAAVLMLLGRIAITRYMPPLEATFKGTYMQFLKSIYSIIKEYPLIIPCAIRSALGFAAFSAMWACMAFHMAEAPFNQGSDVVGLLGLCGFITAIAAANIGKYLPIYGFYKFNIIGLCISFISWALLLWGGNTYVGMIAGIILIDTGQQFIGVANQSTVLALDAQASSRINTIYMTVYFIGGSMGTFAAGQCWEWLGWNGVVIAGVSLLLLATLTLCRK